MQSIALIGFGEAGQAFAGAFTPGVRALIRAYDRKTDHAQARAAKFSDYARAGVAAAETLAAALEHASLALCLVTADQALAAARAAAPHLRAGSFWFDMNSVAPATKRAASAVIEAAGGRYVDVAVMAPVHPSLLAVPLLLSGQHAEDGLAALRDLGFGGRVVAGGAGGAAAIKMIRSIAIKGYEAVTAECVLAAYAAGVQDEVFGSIERSDPGLDWARRAPYSLDRMMVHGLRRAEEMSEAAATAADLGLPGAMAASTAAWQRRIGELRLAPQSSLAATAARLLAALEAHTA